MSDNRLTDYLDHILDAATQAGIYIEVLSKEDFLGLRVCVAPSKSDRPRTA